MGNGTEVGVLAGGWPVEGWGRGGLVICTIAHKAEGLYPVKGQSDAEGNEQSEFTLTTGGPDYLLQNFI